MADLGKELLVHDSRRTPEIWAGIQKTARRRKNAEWGSVIGFGGGIYCAVMAFLINKVFFIVGTSDVAGHVDPMGIPAIAFWGASSLGLLLIVCGLVCTYRRLRL
jgi:hypothetical protein